MLIIRPAQRSTKVSVSTRMNPARHTNSIPCATQGRIEGRIEAFPVRMRRVVDASRRDAGLPGLGEPTGAGAVGKHEGDLGGKIRGPGGRDERAHVGASPGDQDGNAAAGHQIARRPVVRTRSPPASATTVPMTRGASPDSRRAAMTGPESSRAAKTIMPMPQLKVRSISDSATPPVRASHAKTGGTGIAPRSRLTPVPAPRTRGMLSGKPPPVMWHKALMPRVAFSAARSGLT